MSIARAQAVALAEGFLDSIGTDDKSFLRPKNAYSELIVLAGELVDDAQTNLAQMNHVSSGKGSASIIANEPVQDGAVFKVSISMNFYLKFINKGVKGTRSGQSLSGYSFKNEIVSRKMYAAIKEWVDRGKITTRTVKDERGYRRHERKQKRLAKISESNTAYAVARSIKRKGLRPSQFLDKAILKAQAKLGDRLGGALRADIIDSLNKF